MSDNTTPNLKEVPSIR